MQRELVTVAALTLLALGGCAKESAQPPNTPAARDAAPGPLSETSPPSTSAEEQAPRKEEPQADR
jgi:curli biogenesis system outer membrane secretion channel CsgG